MTDQPTAEEKIAAKDKRYRQTETGKQVRRDSAKRHREKFPERVRVYARVKYALKTGRLEKEPCTCGETKVEAHHEDYNKPLDVLWLCKPCHMSLHHPNNG